MLITAASPSDYPDIIEVWELSVRATHDFLPEAYLQHIKSLLPGILPQVPIYLLRGKDGKLNGFLGVADHKIEMLFIHPDSRGRGLGNQFTQYALKELKANKVDVNEQNVQAVGFYQRMGFKPIGRSETDGLGKPFPLIHMEWME